MGLPVRLLDLILSGIWLGAKLVVQLGFFDHDGKFCLVSGSGIWCQRVCDGSSIQSLCCLMVVVDEAAKLGRLKTALQKGGSCKFSDY